jgi:hypothetical protein
LQNTFTGGQENLANCQIVLGSSNTEKQDKRGEWYMWKRMEIHIEFWFKI